jgi:23S rRNA pseudouridine1911/1915/1917 synthase
MGLSAYPFEVVYEDNHLLGVNKHSGLLVQGDKTGDQTLADFVKDWLKHTYQKPGNVFCGIIHRIDRPVSGLVIVAKTSKGLERMNALFRDRKVEKVYLAVVEGQPAQPEGRLVHWLLKDPEANKSTAYLRAVPNALEAVLSYQLACPVRKGYSLLMVKPTTGRPHQIRVQLASMGTPIAGDLKYGSKQALPDQSIALHAFRAAFVHPVKQEAIQLQAPVPEQSPWILFKEDIDAL